MSDADSGPRGIVDAATGEVRAAGCPQCAELASKLAAAVADREVLEAEVTRQLRRIAALQKVKDAERMADPQRPEIVAVFDYWREHCNHPGSKFDAAYFDLIKARLRTFSADELKEAILGAAVDAFADAKGKRHDRLGLVFQNAERVEDFRGRWARWRRDQSGEMPRPADPQHAAYIRGWFAGVVDGAGRLGA